MPFTSARRGAKRLRAAIRAQLLAPQILAFLPAVTLAGFWIGGQTALLVLALVVPGLFAFGGLFGTGPRVRIDGVTGLPARETAVAALDAALPVATGQGRAAAALSAMIDHAADALADLDDAGRDSVLTAVADRIAGALRDADVVARSGPAEFAIALTDLRRADHEALTTIARRLQDAVSEPISVDGQRVFVTLSVGFCLPGKTRDPGANAMMAAADRALAMARAAGGATVRGYDPGMARADIATPVTDAELAHALDAGEIQPWFQPQVAAGDGRLLGFEALARWHHPKRGVIQPDDFLPRAMAAGFSRRLVEVMLYGALQNLRAWDRAGLRVPSVSVNFTPEDLVSPDIADRVRWELDRFDLAPDRFVVEVLETALDGTDDATGHNLRALRDLGCGIDIDDFGRGSTSIARIRRFAATRLKIDRSLVSGLDRDTAQREVAAAIITMARGLGVATLAEGVERIGERTVLAEIGCDAVQGFGIARPMPAEDAPGWIAAWQGRHGLADLPARTLHMREPTGKTA
jgi:diguanylate cyclase (GGDEF)-like protein